MYNDTKERVFKIDYVVSDAYVAQHKFYQLVICQVPKIDSETQISFGYSVASQSKGGKLSR